MATLLSLKNDRHKSNDVGLKHFVHPYCFVKWLEENHPGKDRWWKYVYSHRCYFGSRRFNLEKIRHRNPNYWFGINIILIWNLCNLDDLSAAEILVNEEKEYSWIVPQRGQESPTYHHLRRPAGVNTLSKSNACFSALLQQTRGHIPYLSPGERPHPVHPLRIIE